MSNDDFTDIVTELLASSSMLAELADLTPTGDSNHYLLSAATARVQAAIQSTLCLIPYPDETLAPAPSVSCGCLATYEPS